jgi:glycosyltransferase involved in cell wall biosynthesis
MRLKNNYIFRVSCISLPRASYGMSVQNFTAGQNGLLPEKFYTFHEKPGTYLAFFGRISPERRVDDAIKVAKRVGLPLKIAAKADKVDREYG